MQKKGKRRWNIWWNTRLLAFRMYGINTDTVWHAREAYAEMNKYILKSGRVDESEFNGNHNQTNQSMEWATNSNEDSTT